MRRRLYRKGRKLSMTALAKRLLRQEYVYLGDKPMHPAWLGSMHFWTLAWQCRSGRVRAAINNERKSCQPQTHS